MSDYSIDQIHVGDRVRCKGETYYGEVIEIGIDNEDGDDIVAVRYDDGAEYDIDVTAIDSIIGSVEIASEVSEPTTPAELKSAPVEHKGTPWDGNGRPPVGAIVDIVSTKRSRWTGRAWRVIKNNPKKVQVIDESGQVMNAPATMLRPSTRKFFTNPASNAVPLRIGSVVTYSGSASKGFEKGRLWVIVSATKGRSNGWNIAPLDPPASFHYSYVQCMETDLKVRKFAGLVIPV